MTKNKLLLVSVVSVVSGALAFLSACAQEAPFNPTSPDEYDPEPGVLSADRAADGHLRLVAANISTGNLQSYEDPGIRIFRGLAPDVAMIQEFNYKGNSAAELRSFVDQAFGPEYSYFREVGTFQIPNGIVSRYPILESGTWTDANVANRGFAWARIDIPGPVDLYAISVHLLTSSAVNRNAEAAQLVQHINQIPSGAYVVLGGDFNTGTRTEACVQTLAPVLATGGPFPVDGVGNDGTSGSRSKPHDWVLVSPGLQGKESAVDIGSRAFDHGFVADTRVYAPIADLAPALASDSGASNMQHMAVVRDFVVGGEPPTASLHVSVPNGGETWEANSTHSITWTASGVSAVKIEYTIDGLSWTTLSTSTPASDGAFAWTLPQTASTAARVRVSAAPGGSPSDASDTPFNIHVTPVPPPPPPPTGSAHVFMNELLANEPGADANGEFVELVNGGTGDADLSGWTLSDARTVRHVFAAGTVLRAGAALVVYGAAAGIPAGVANAVGSSTGLLSLTNGGDTVTLANAQGTVDRVSYGADLAAVDGLSMNRKPDGDPAGTFVAHTVLSPARPSSPGKRADGSAWGGGGPPPPPPPPGAPDITSEAEPNDTAATASGPAGRSAIAGALASATDVDWFRIDLAQPGQVTIALKITGSADLDWFLYAKSDATALIASGYTTRNPEVGSATVSAGTYYLKVAGYQGAAAPYSLQLTLP